MALNRLTKIDGGGISTTSDYRVGIITASKFVGPIEGTITATDGTFSGNVTIGGTLTYEDVTNIDSVGIITARDGIDCNADLDVDGHTNLDNVNIAGVTTVSSQINFGGGTTQLQILNSNDSDINHNESNGSGLRFRVNGATQMVVKTNSITYGTSLRNYYIDRIATHSGDSDTEIRFPANDTVSLETGGSERLRAENTGVIITGIATVSGNIDANGDLDVDGHTNLDNVSIAGVTTITGSGTALQVGGGTNPHSTKPTVNISPSSGNAMLTLRGESPTLYFDKTGSGHGKILTDTVNLSIYNGAIDNQGTEVVRIAGNGNVSVYKDLDVDGHTNLDNVNIAGVTTTSDTIHIKADNKYLSIGAHNDGDMLLYHDGNKSVLVNYTGDFHIRTNNGSRSSLEGIILKPNGATEIYHSGNKIIETDSLGINVDGRLDVVGTGANDHLNVGTNTGRLRIGGYADLQLYHDSTNINYISNHNDIDLHITSTYGGSPVKTQAKFIHDGAVELFHNDDKKFQTQASGAKIFNTAGSGGTRLEIQGKENEAAILQLNADDGDDNADYSRIYHGTDGAVLFQNYTSGNWETNIKTIGNGTVELYHDNTKRLETSATGITVTGEVAATQDYPNIRPLLDFNFAATKKLDPRLEYQRTGPASFVNEFGNIVFVGDNTPRFDHDPVTRESKGILIEEQRSNDVANSQNVGGYSGGYMNGGTFTYPDDVVAPDGSTKGVLKMVSDTSTGYHGVQYTISGFGSNQNWAYQVWVKALPGSSINEITLYDNAQSGATNNGSLVMNTTTGVFSYNGNNAESVAYNNGWYQIKIKGTRATTNAQSAMLLVLYNGSSNQYAGDGSSGFYVWGGQYENNTHHWTSYIPTYGTTATRGRDELAMSGSDLTDVFNNKEGTMFYEASLGDLTNDNQPIVAFRDLGTVTANYHAMGWRIGGGTSVIRTWFKTSSNNEHLSAHSSTGLTANMFYKHIYGYKDADCADAYRTPTNSGILSNQTGDGSPMIAAGVVDELRFGGYYAYESQPTTYGLDAGHIKRFSYWPQKLTNTQLSTYIS